MDRHVTPLGTVLVEKMTVAHTAKIFPAIHETRNFTAVFSHCSYSILLQGPF
jgi:hypothetical protein